MGELLAVEAHCLERNGCHLVLRQGDGACEALRAMPRLNPESRYVEPFAENRYLEIARGNDETEFGRRACLDINAEIIEIATAGEGLALYWKAAGPKVVAKSNERPCVGQCATV